MHRGYVKIWRKLEDSFFFKDSQAVHLWVHILTSVNHKNKEFMFNNKKQICKKGSMVTGMNKLSENTGINKSKIKRILDMLESETLIETLRNNKFSIISVVNWEKYQPSETQNETPVKRQRNASETPVKPNNNIKNEKKEEYSEDFESFWSDYDRKGSKKDSYVLWKKLNQDEKVQALIYINAYKKEMKEKTFMKDAERYLKAKLWEGKEVNITKQGGRKRGVIKI